MRKQDFFGWVFVFVFGTIGGLVGTIFFAIWFIGCADETFTSAEAPLLEPDSGKERMILMDGGGEAETDVSDASADTFVRDSSKIDSAPTDPPCSPDADIGDATALAANGPNSPSSCFQVTRDTGMAIVGYTPDSCLAPADCPKSFPSKPLSYVCYGGDGGLNASGCTLTGQGTANNWWYCCL